MKIIYFFLFSLVVTNVHCRLTKNELADRAFNYFSDTDRIKKLDERDVDTILKEIDVISKRDGLDKNTVLQQLSQQLTTQMQYHEKNMHSKWSHTSLVPAVACAAAGIGLLGLAIFIYKKCNAPFNIRFDAIAQNLKQYGIKISERTEETHQGSNHVIQNHIIHYVYTRHVTTDEKSIILSRVEQLCELRKSQSEITRYDMIPGGGFSIVPRSQLGFGERSL